MADLKILISIVCFFACVSGERSDDIGALVARLEQLELKDAAKQRKIEELEIKEERLKLELNELKDKLESHSCDCDNHISSADFTDKDIISTDRTRKQKNRIVRVATEDQVAFYATHTDKAIHHLGANQALTFNNVITNVGSAFKANGMFVAPVKGTYVFHGTIMGRDVHNATDNKFSAHFDVDGISYSKFYPSEYEQSSQMIVIDLQPGQTVSIRNVHPDEGYVGNHQTTFSGFLLYLHDYVAGTIVGK
ncbi:hypothetical protein ACF0H5_001706 [Mactra antiquata]